MRHTLYTKLALLILVPVVCGSTTLRAQQPSADGKPTNAQAQPGSHAGPGGLPPPFPEAKAISQPKNGEELAAAIKKLADALASSGRFSGSILVAADGKPLVEAAWGEADREQKIANTPETAYDVGSIGKLLTQIAMRLSEST
jgi:CubicO group peptidase (beta-lactamase class C family)